MCLHLFAYSILDSVAAMLEIQLLCWLDTYESSMLSVKNYSAYAWVIISFTTLDQRKQNHLDFVSYVTFKIIINLQSVHAYTLRKLYRLLRALGQIR